MVGFECIKLGSIFQISAPDEEETSVDSDCERNSMDTLTDPSTSVSKPKRAVKASKMRSKTLSKHSLRSIRDRARKKSYKKQTRKSILSCKTDDEDNYSLSTMIAENSGDSVTLESERTSDGVEENNAVVSIAGVQDVKSENIKLEATIDIEVPNDHNEDLWPLEVKEESNLLEYDDEECVEWQQLYVSGSNPVGNPLSVSCGYPSPSTLSGTPQRDRLLYFSMDNRLTFSDLEQLKLNHKGAAGAIRETMNDFRKVYGESHQAALNSGSNKTKRSKGHYEGARTSRKQGSSDSVSLSFCSPDLFTDDAEIIPLPSFKNEDSRGKNASRELTPQIHQPGRMVVDFNEAPASSKGAALKNGTVALAIGVSEPVQSCNDLEPPGSLDGSLPMVAIGEKEEPTFLDDAFVTKPKKRYYPRVKEQLPEKCAAFLNLSYDESLTMEFERIVLEMNLNSIESCCQELMKLRKISEQKQARLYHSIAQGKVLTHLKSFTDSEKHLDNILKSRNIQLESTQRNNYSKLYRFYLKYKQICNYNTSSSYVIKNFPLVKRVFEAGLVIT